MSNYYDLLYQEEREAKKRAAAYASTRRAQAEQRAAQSDASYAEQKAAYRRQAQATLAETEESFEQAYDANAVDELVARRHATEAIANSNLANSGLNSTQQTAISLGRMRADADTTAARQAAIERVMRALDEREAGMTQAAASAREDIFREAEEDISRYREREEERMWSNADARYKHVGAQTTYTGGGTINADMTYTPSYVTVRTNAMMRQRRHGDASASDYLHNMFCSGHISFEQWKGLHERFSIVPCKEMSIGAIRAIMEIAAEERGEKEGRLFVEYLLENGILTTAEADGLMQELYKL